jgi:hypothetical protein
MSTTWTVEMADGRRAEITADELELDGSNLIFKDTVAVSTVADEPWENSHPSRCSVGNNG